jgi:hypothetical protein
MTNMMTSLMVEAALRKYGFPLWAKPYIVHYVNSIDRSEVKRSVGFLKFGRKKGSITAKEVRLPNGIVFKMEDVIHILNLFYYGELKTSEVSGIWANANDGNKAHSDYFKMMQQFEVKRARAVKNFVQGLGHKVDTPPKELTGVFDSLANLSNWNERIVAKRILLYYSYVNPISEIFYRVFYPVSSEFLRPLAKVFIEKGNEEQEGTRAAEKVIMDGYIEKARLEKLTEDIMVNVAKSIKAEIPRAEKIGRGKEAELLMRLAVAHPVHKLADLGADIDPDEELKKIWKKVK